MTSFAVSVSWGEKKATGLPLDSTSCLLVQLNNGFTKFVHSMVDGNHSLTDWTKPLAGMRPHQQTQGKVIAKCVAEPHMHPVAVTDVVRMPYLGAQGRQVPLCNSAI